MKSYFYILAGFSALTTAVMAGDMSIATPDVQRERCIKGFVNELRAVAPEYFEALSPEDRTEITNNVRWWVEEVFYGQYCKWDYGFKEAMALREYCSLDAMRIQMRQFFSGCKAVFRAGHPLETFNALAKMTPDDREVCAAIVQAGTIEGSAVQWKYTFAHLTTRFLRIYFAHEWVFPSDVEPGASGTFKRLAYRIRGKAYVPCVIHKWWGVDGCFVHDIWGHLRGYTVVPS